MLFCFTAFFLCLSQRFFQHTRINNISAQQRVDLSAINEKKKKTTEDPDSAHKYYELQQSVWEGTIISMHMCIQTQSPTHASSLVTLLLLCPPLFALNSCYSIQPTPRFTTAIQMDCNRSQKMFLIQNQHVSLRKQSSILSAIRPKKIIYELNNNMEN